MFKVETLRSIVGAAGTMNHGIRLRPLPRIPNCYSAARVNSYVRRQRTSGTWVVDASTALAPAERQKRRFSITKLEVKKLKTLVACLK